MKHTVQPSVHYLEHFLKTLEITEFSMPFYCDDTLTPSKQYRGVCLIRLRMFMILGNERVNDSIKNIERQKILIVKFIFHSLEFN